MVGGLAQLELLAKSREPLEAGHLTALPELAGIAYRRACFLIQALPGCPDEAVEPSIRALQSLREVLGGDDGRLDRDLFHQALRTIVDLPGDRGQTAVVGAAAGVLYGEGRMADGELVRLGAGFLGGTSSDPRRSAGFIRGLLATAREVAWQVAGLLKSLDERFRGWDDDSFLGVLPELRLAFADLTPREIAGVAEAVSGLHGGAALTGLVHGDVSEADALLAADVARRVRASLRADGLLTEGRP